MSDTKEYDVAINGAPHYVGTAFRQDPVKAKAIFADVVGRRNSNDVVTFICDGKVIDTKAGARKPSSRAK